MLRSSKFILLILLTWHHKSWGHICPLSIPRHTDTGCPRTSRVPRSPTHRLLQGRNNENYYHRARYRSRKGNCWNFSKGAGLIAGRNSMLVLLRLIYFVNKIMHKQAKYFHLVQKGIVLVTTHLLGLIEHGTWFVTGKKCKAVVQLKVALENIL